MKKAVIVDGLRTPFGRYKGGLKSIRPDDLASIVIQNLVEKNKINHLTIDDVVLGGRNFCGKVRRRP